MPINYKKTYETLSYEESIEFRDLTIKVMREIYPHYIIQPLEAMNPETILITNKQDNVRITFPLYDLYARFSTTGKTKNDLKETLLNAYASMLKMAEDASVIRDDSKLEWLEVKDFVRPRFARRDEFTEVEDFVYYPFGEDVVTAFVIDDREAEQLVSWVKNSMLEKWNIAKDDFMKKAMENFAKMCNELEMVGTMPPRGFLRSDSSLDIAATAILIGGIRHMIAENVGKPFRLGIPSRFVFFAWGELEDEEFQTEMSAMMKREFSRLPSKLTTNIYEVDEKGQIKQLKDQPKAPEVPKTSNN